MRTGTSFSTGGQPLADSISGRPTNVRWAILVMMCLMYLITYIDRACISVVAPAISKEFGFSKVQMGVIFSAFAWAYAMGQAPGGWLGDCFGPRRVLPSMVLFWSAMTMLTAQAFSFASFVVIRFVFGAGEAGAFPTSTRAIQHWYPNSERGLVNGLMHSFALFAVSVVPLMVVAIMQAWGWRSVFHICGMFGVVWSIVYFVIYRDRPEQHKGVNEAELAHIRGRAADGSINAVREQKKPVVPWGIILRSSNTWFLAIAYGSYNYAMYFFVYWLPSYLVEHHHVSMKSMGVLASVPLFAGAIGGVTGGTLTDIVYRKTHSLKNARRLVCVMSMLGCAVFLLPSAVVVKPAIVIWCMSGSVFFLALILGPAWAVAMDIGKEYSGSVSGVMNTMGNGIGAISPIVFGYLAQRGMWVAPFVVAAVVLVAGAFMWGFLVNPEKSVVERQQTAVS